MGIFDFFNGSKKISLIDKLTINEKENFKFITKAAVIYQVINFDDSISKKTTNIFHRYKRELMSNLIPDENTKIEDSIKNLQSRLNQDVHKYEILRSMSEVEKDDFFEHLIAFTFIEGKSEKEFTLEKANFIGDILRNIYENKNDDEVRDMITSLVKKYSNSKILTKKTNKKILRFPNGKVFMETNFKDGPEDVLEGGFKIFYKSGQLKTEGNYKNNKWHGRIKDFSEEGILISDVTMENGVENGEDILYHSNGNIKQKSIKVNGKMDGLVEVYTEDGKIGIDQIYVNGEETGRFRQYYNSGALKTTAEKVKGEFKGLMKVFWETGEIQVELNYDTNLMKTYNVDGTLHTEKTLED